MLVKTLTGFHPFLRSRISGTSYSWVVRSFSHCQSSLFKESQEHTPIQRIFLLCWALSTACSSAGLAEVSLPEAQRQGRWGLPAGAPTLQDPRPPPARSGRPASAAPSPGRQTPNLRNWLRFPHPDAHQRHSHGCLFQYFKHGEPWYLWSLTYRVIILNTIDVPY